MPGSVVTDRVPMTKFQCFIPSASSVTYKATADAHDTDLTINLEFGLQAVSEIPADDLLR